MYLKSSYIYIYIHCLYSIYNIYLHFIYIYKSYIHCIFPKFIYHVIHTYMYILFLGPKLISGCFSFVLNHQKSRTLPYCISWSHVFVWWIRAPSKMYRKGTVMLIGPEPHTTWEIGLASHVFIPLGHGGFLRRTAKKIHLGPRSS